ncbi:hypothetical protein BKE38_24880 [Pseudoroseomonas deserti]|uniref:Hedgehog/Intein (Hint) domain-containing protein n=1 Tax=Teichococcus deserti TaxID=1817963 RepID=A0A1V2GW41_9PROT|nr:Hint domain-containing protein [Pseudoroseomonas deserti]ONG46742.1 hypothetical protein BKE38_24880 [Pseudoroseomonas deserti]
MASYTTLYYYQVGYDGGSNQWLILSAATASTSTADDGTGDSSFDLGDYITVQNSSLDDPTLEYLGHSGDGWIGHTADMMGRDDTYFLSNDGSLALNTPISPFSTAAMTVCFLAGTAIATPGGPRAIETLAIGDAVLTAAGEARPIRWIGRQSVVAVFADPARDVPIRIQAGALAENLPQRDLYVSPDHALALDGLLVQAGALVNGGSIRRVAAPAPRFTYFHIELDDHALILAEGVAAETFVDNVTRRRFDNHADYVARYGAAAAATGELPAPRVKSSRQLPAALRARLQARADLLRPTAAAA